MVTLEAVAIVDEVAPGGPRLSAVTLAETVRRAAASGTADGLRPLVELAVGSGAWDAGSILACGPGRRLVSAAQIGDRAIRCDELQRELGEGPALDAVSSAGTTLACDLLADRRWPRWSSAVTAIGVRSVVSVRLVTSATVGVLNLYGTSPRVHIRSAVADAELVGIHMSVLLEAATVRHHLERGLSARTTVGQAQGILMQRYGLTPVEAFELLRNVSQHRNIRLAVLADQLIRTGVLPGFQEWFESKGSERMSTAEPVASGQTYRVAEVNGRAPAGLDEFVGDVDLLLSRGGTSLRIVGSGSRQQDTARVHQKDPASPERDVRVWIVRENLGATFLAEALGAF